MKPSLYLLITALFMVSCDQQEVATQQVQPSTESVVTTTTIAAQQFEPDNYDDCITQGVSGDLAAIAITEVCRNKFPTESQEVVEAPAPVVTDASRMVVRNGIVYDVNSNTPFTGVFSHPETGLATFKDGKYDGVREEYFEDGTLESRRIYKDGQQDGLSEQFDENGTLRYRANYKGDVANGIFEQYFVNGTLEIRGNLKDGLADGLTEYYFENGTLKTGINFKNEKPDGIVESYLEDGTLEDRTNWKDGEILWQCHQPGCTLSGQQEIAAQPVPTESQEVVEAPAPVVVDDSTLVTTRNGIKYEVNSSTPFTGISLSYHENGQVNQRATFKDGKMEGITEDYFENGTLRVRANVKDGEVEGFTETYYEDGTLASRAYRKDGEFDGIVEMYLEDGTLNFRMNFKDGELLGRCFEPGCTDFN